MVANLTAVRLCWFRNGTASLQRSNGNRWENNLEPSGNDARQPSTGCGRSEQT